MASVSANGSARAAPVPRAGQDGAEQIGALVALVGRLSGPRAASGPLPHEAVLLPDPGFVLEPDLDWRPLGQSGQMRAQRAREVFL
jgi:hypothetical protein